MSNTNDTNSTETLDFNKRLFAKKLTKEIQFWKTYLSENNSCTAFPYDYKIGESEMFSISFDLSTQLYKDLNKLSNNSDLRLYFILITALKALINKFTDNNDISLVTPVFAKDSGGELSNHSLIIRSKIDTSLSFKELLIQVRKNILDAVDNQNYPIELIFEDILQETTQNGKSISDIGIVYTELQNAENLKTINPGILFSFSKNNDSITCKVDFDASHYKSSTISLIADYYLILLRNSLEDINKPLAEISLINDEIKSSIFEFLNKDTNQYFTGDCIHREFEKIVEKHHENTALVFGEQSLSYQELNSKANQLAYKLIEKGVCKGTHVALLINRSLEMVISILAVIKAGGIYVPIDLAYPESRKNYILNDCEAKYVLHKNDKELKELPGTQCKNIIEVDLDNTSIYSGKDTNPETEISLNDLAYIIYTSGTTGNPKGSLISHGNVMSLMNSTKSFYSFNETDTWTLFHSYCFDFSVWEMYGALLYGGKLIVIPEAEAKVPALFLQTLKERKVTVLNQTPPSFYNIIAEELKNPEKDLDIKWVIFGGFALSPIKLKEWNEKYPQTKLINMYGITETTVHVTLKEISSEDIAENISNIGKPIPSLNVYIFDKNLNLLPFGIAGELCVAGEGLAKSYLNRDDLTHTKFIKNPLNENEKIYRSGDLARLLPSGDIEYLGRIDNQVKIRGYRIELGEVENQLRRINDIDDVFVNTFDGEDFEKSICAYLVAKNKISSNEIREHLVEVIPSYMIPSYFIILDKFPLSSNGKIDIKALPNPLTYDYSEIVAPENDMQETILNVWKKILSIKNIGVTHNFFEIGGDSINAIQVVIALKNKGVDLDVNDLFIFQTIKEICQKSSSLKMINNVSSEAETLAEEIQYFDSEVTEKIETLIHDTLDGKHIRFFPQTPMQKSIFAHYMKTGTSSEAYIGHLTFTINGELNVEIINQVLKILVKKHESLRTNFFFEPFNEFIQVVFEEKELSLNYFDNSSLNEEERESFILEQISLDKKKGFDLSKDNLIRIYIFKNSENEYQVLFSSHHIILDGWCQSILLNEFITIYSSLINEIEFVITPVPGYVNYINWLQKQSKEEAMEYWNNVLADSEFQQPLSSFKKKNKSEGYENQKNHISFDENELATLKQYASSNHITINDILMTLWGITLQKYSGNEDVIFGYVVSGRPTEIIKIDQILGLFINTLPVRLKQTKKGSIVQIIKGIQQQVIQSQKYNYVSINDINKQIGTGDFSIDHIYGFENYPLADIQELVAKENPGFTIDNFSVNELANFDLQMQIVPDDNLSVVIQFNSNAFDSGFIQHLLSHYKMLVLQAISNPELEIQDLKYTSDDEDKELLITYNQTEADCPRDKTIHEIFVEQAKLYPNKTAVKFYEQEITYKDLDQESNKVANWLLDKGISVNNIVAIYIDRSIEMIISIMGILKSGAAYLPIDPTMPEERIKYMLEDTQASCIITSANYYDKLSSDNQCEDINTILTSDQTNYNKVQNSVSTDLAYIIFTSGTTGDPKGILIRHLSVMRIVKDTDYVDITSEENFLLLSNYAFDGSIFDIFGALLNGSCLSVLKSESITNIDELSEIIEKQKITMFFITTALFNTIIEYKAESLKNIKRICFGGERVSFVHAKKALEVLGPHKVIHVYGPTETTVFATTLEINTIDESLNTIPIGKPIANTSIYILDENLKLQPKYVSGELYIGGDGLSIGYLKDDKLTQEKYIDNPYNKNEKIYKSGDLVRLLPDGNIEFVDRIDKQVKIRGFRIELGEIETVLSSHEQINASIVLVNDDESTTKDLIAYYVSTQTISSPDLISWLSKKLPDFMIPKYFIRIDEMPMKSTGKIDVKKLPKAEITNDKSNYAPPENEEQTQFIEIWKNVLSISEIGIDDNFFMIGGDSIKAIQISSRIQQIGYDISVKQIFDSPTIRELSKNIEKAECKFDQDLVTGEHTLMPIQKWFVERNFSAKNHFNMSVMLFNSIGYETDIVNAVFAKIVEQHDVFRIQLSDDNSQILYQEIKSIESKIQLFDFTNDDNYESRINEEVDKIQASLNIHKGPLFKLAYFSTKDGGYLFITIHHFIFDGVSWRILLEDFSEAYQQMLDGKEISLPLKVHSFKHWVEELNKYSQSDALLKEANYWNDISKNIETQKIPNITFKEARQLNFELTELETSNLLREVNKAYNTEINEVLLTALGYALTDWDNKDKHVILLEGHGREDIIEDINITRTIGWFTTQFPVLIEITENDLGEQIQLTKEHIRNIPNKGIGYGLLKHLCQKNISDKENYQYEPDISFNYLGQFDNTESSLFQLSPLGGASEISPDNELISQISINAIVQNSKLTYSVTYNNNLYTEESIHLLTEKMQFRINQLIDHCIGTEETILSPSDFTSDDISFDDLDDILSEIN